MRYKPVKSTICSACSRALFVLQTRVQNKLYKLYKIKIIDNRLPDRAMRVRHPSGLWWRTSQLYKLYKLYTLNLVMPYV